MENRTISRVAMLMLSTMHVTNITLVTHAFVLQRQEILAD